MSIPRFRAAAVPIRFLLLVMRGGSRLRSSARFALHKLLGSQARSVIQKTEGGKDLHQAALLLEVLTENRPGNLSAAARALAESGPAVTRELLRGLEAALERWPDSQHGAGIVRPVLSE